MTLWVCSLGTGIAPVGGDFMNLAVYRPPWEIEICFTGPADTDAWNWFMNFQPVTRSGRTFVWQPGVQNLPQRKKHIYFNAAFGNASPEDAWGQLTSKKRIFNVEFEREVPDAILSHKALYMSLQWIDVAHVRGGFKANPRDSWYLSNVYDYSLLTEGEELGDFAQMDWGTTTGRAWGAPPGSRPFQKIMIDYIPYRYGLSV